MVSSFSVESFGCNINDNESNQGSDLSHTIHNITKKVFINISELPSLEHTEFGRHLESQIVCKKQTHFNHYLSSPGLNWQSIIIEAE